MSARDLLAGELRAEGGLLAGALSSAAAAPAVPAPDAAALLSPDTDALAARAAAGARGVRAPDDYALTLAAVREGYLLHYGDGDVVQPQERDLGLLGGDRLYALGLARLAALGDLDAVAELADLISLCAQAHAGGGSGAQPLADAAWEAAAAAIGDGPTIAHTRAKERARAGEVDAAAALRDAASSRDRP
ncbi:hypothetical protein Q5424_03520 [Conexibacter sp. JD483]|uniref:hypothetical protein n=1 Tax=unclassified Conexibacter TaxID=2627773 RepID=UPI00271959ED|nr:MULTISPECIES: hypothetical protein [unclassified Conexibacter]MDO8184424.1 hypothetical protein [Conexibacter sp. CPCC 205706]MDO8197730.1 hypothetical protein [Conexibacter sp. CPCC 205762]MDR9368134.1 hypothetical protein [Conexibacter sp. JD483]